MIFKATLLASILFFFSTSYAVESEQPLQIKTNYTKGYIPNGFDSNDHVQIVGEGFFSNSCYKPALSVVEVNHEEKTINIQANAYEYSGFCLQYIVEYSQTLNVGLLKSGTYKVLQGERKLEVGSVNIKPATSTNADDFLYAPINQAYLERVEGKNILSLSGSFTNECMVLTEVKIDVQPDVIVVQPISEMNGHDCQAGNYEFNEKVEINSPVAAGRYLLHIRSMNGKAINNLVDIK